VNSTPLAILGGRPLFADPRHVGAPFLPPRDLLHASLDAILDRRRLSNDGPMVRELEQVLAARHGVAHAVAMCNATLAMQLLFRALELCGAVVMPAFTFVATAHAATWEGLEPEFVDIDRDTHCIDPRAAARGLARGAAAIVGVHLWGRTCDTERLEIVARTANVPLVCDAAQALGCDLGHRGRGGTPGTGPRASVLSLHATKIVSGLEGGAVLTDDEDLAERLRRLRNFGFEGYDLVGGLGTNAKLNEFSAAFALCGIEWLDRLIPRNLARAMEYRRCLAGLPGVTFHAPAAAAANHHYAVALVDPARCPLTRDELVAALWADNVLARRYFHPGCHRMEPYASRPAAGRPPLSLPVTDEVAARVLVLPTGSAVEDGDVPLICGRIRQALDEHRRVRDGIRRRAAA